MGTDGMEVRDRYRDILLENIDYDVLIQNPQIDQEQMDEIVRDVKNSAYEIIEKKGATFYAVALAIRRIAEALIRDEHSLLTVSGYCSGAYEIEDVCIGLPMILGRDGIENIVEIPLNQLEKDNLHESADALKKVLTDMGIN